MKFKCSKVWRKKIELRQNRNENKNNRTKNKQTNKITQKRTDKLKRFSHDRG